MEKKLTARMELPYFMYDCQNRLKPEAFMDIAQELAIHGSEQINAPERVLRPKNLAWVLARMNVRYVHQLQRSLTHEQVTLETWHKGLNGLYFIRDFRLLGPDGQPAVLGTSSWVVMNIAERRLVRTDSLTDWLDFTPQNTESAIDTPAPKVMIPRSATPSLARTHEVRFSDLDNNGHVNNVRYTVWAMDSLPLALLRDHNIQEISINFNMEAHIGETVELWHAESDGAHYIEGKANGQQSFIFKLTTD